MDGSPSLLLATCFGILIRQAARCRHALGAEDACRGFTPAEVSRFDELRWHHCHRMRLAARPGGAFAGFGPMKPGWQIACSFARLEILLRGSAG